MGVDLRMIADRVSEQRGVNESGKKLYTLWDVYPACDLVTYPSTYEGYGNAFVEAIYFRRPIVVNRYSIFEADIEPKGFDVIAFDHFITEQTLDDVRQSHLGQATSGGDGGEELHAGVALPFVSRCCRRNWSRSWPRSTGREHGDEEQTRFGMDRRTRAGSESFACRT